MFVWQFLRFQKWMFLLVPALLFGNQRLSSDPFISGDGFRAYADYVYDETDRSLNPSAIKPNSTLFVKTDYLGEFFTKIHPQIPGRYILISHNSDDSAPGSYWHMLNDDKLIAWFAQNMEGDSHPKLHPIPIGIANRYWAHGNPIEIQEAIQAKKEKIHLVYCNFSIWTYYPERSEVFRILASAPFCYQAAMKSFGAYLADVAISQFVLSPRGNGLDTHRLWEALYLGSYPIVRTSSLDPLYEGLPVIVIQEWSEVTETFLIQKYEELQQKLYSLDRLKLSYWTGSIDRFKEQP